MKRILLLSFFSVIFIIAALFYTEKTTYAQLAPSVCFNWNPCDNFCDSNGICVPSAACRAYCVPCGGDYACQTSGSSSTEYSAGRYDCWHRFGLNYRCYALPATGPSPCELTGGTCVSASSQGVGACPAGTTYNTSISCNSFYRICCAAPGAQPPAPPPPPPPRYNINGYVWIDNNRDGTKQSNEPFYTDNLTVRLSGAASATTDTINGTPGPYTFSGYLAGNYTVSIPSLPSGYVATTTTSQSFFLNANRFNVNFGIVPIYSISGNVFNDMNKDRVKDIIDPVTNPVMEPNITSGITITTSGGNLSVNSSAGTYTITNLYEGLYTVSYTSAIPPSYFMIYPLNGPPPQFRIYVGTNCYLNANLSFGSTCYGLNNGNVQEANFAISNSIPWFQTYGLNMRIDQGFEDKIPSTPSYPAYASVSDNANGASNLVTPTPSFTPTPTPTNTPSPTPPPNWGNCNAWDQWGRSHPGVCYDRNTTSCQTYYDAGNFCPGGNSIQCCVNSQVACVSPHTNGFCHNRYSNYGGNIYPCSQTWYSGGYCPGPNDVQCCAP